MSYRRTVVLAGLLLALLSASPGIRAQPSQGFVTYPIVTNYNLDSTSFTYPLFNPVIATGPGPAKTAGSSTTISAVTGTPFTALGVGDEMIFSLVDGTVAIRRVTACTPSCGAAATSITVDSAIDLGTVGVQWQYRHLTDGSGAAQGWVDCANFASTKTFNVQLDQGDATVVQVQVEVRAMGSTNGSIAITPVTLGTPPDGKPLAVVESEGQCRVGLKLATDPSDAGANIEKVQVYFSGRKA